VLIGYSIYSNEYVRVCVIDHTLSSLAEKSFSINGLRPKYTTVEVVGDLGILAVAATDVFYVIKADLPAFLMTPYDSNVFT